MDLWVIIKQGNSYVLRQWAIRPDGTVGADLEVAMASDLAVLRGFLPPHRKRADSRAMGLANMVEAWS
jgi:hypothetical protein